MFMKTRSGQRPLIGVVINEPDQNFYSKTMYHLQKEIFAHEADAAIFNTLLTQPDQNDIENSVFSLMRPELLDGLIVFGYTVRYESTLEELRRFIDHSGIPAVYVESHADGMPCVMFDNDECADKIVRHLTEWHHVKEICYVSGPADSIFHNRVLDSFRRSFEAQGIELTEDRVFHGKDWVCDYGTIADDIISHGIPEAVVCCSDFTAAGIVGAFAEKGLNVPEDVIVTGYSMNEPFASDYMNITSIERRPESMAVEAVRRLMAQVNGTEYSPAEKKPCCVLRKGITCGCEKINYPSLARAAMNNMVSTRRDGFDSYYNSMSETLVSASAMEDFLWKLDWYTHYLGEPEGFWLCLNEGIMHIDGDDLPDYSDKMQLVYQRHEHEGELLKDVTFSRDRMLPEIFEKHDKPAAYIFNCLHFGHVNFGYTVVSYGDSGAFFDQHYVMWLRYTALALNKQRKNIIYNDTVSNDQTRDSLTGLLNVRGFKKVMTHRCGSFDMPDKLMRLISVDVENLKGINSAYGYSEGDRVLQKLATVLNNSASDDDICVRVSGDEFFICGLIDAAVPIDEVPVNLERNLHDFNKNSVLDYGVHFFTSRVTAPVTSAEILDTLPYEANYQRKALKDDHSRKHGDMSRANETNNDNFDTEERKLVAKILNDNLLTYHFQPIVRADTGRIVAYEALMRYEGERKISPLSILSHAQAMGRLDDVERHTMFNLLKFCHEHREEFSEKRLFINSIPSCTLPDKDFEELCTTYSDIVSRIVIEFTEQTAASEQQLKKVLERRDKYGFGLAIDDYGTGYSNISSLLTFMPNCVKIDRSLIMNIHEDKRKQHFAQNIIDYAHDNRFMVLAEGVEKTEELKMLISMGIDLLQGYLTAKPAPKLAEAIYGEIEQKIRDFNRMTKSAPVRKTFFTKDDQVISLRSLDFDNYTDLFLTTERCTLKGADEHSSLIKIRVKDGLDTKLTLENATLGRDNSDACINLGKGSRLTLEIIGSVKLCGPIHVPAGAWLDITGSGDLSMESSITHSYGIGSDILSPYGSIGVHLGGRLTMTLDGEHCIGIGGGYSNDNSKIDISCGVLDIKLMGKHLICIGANDSDIGVTIRDTKLIMNNRCVTGMGIGCGKGGLNALIENCEIEYDASGDSISGICTVSEDDSRAVIRKTKIRMIMHGKNIVGVGSAQGRLSVDAEGCEFALDCEGARAIGVGCLSADSKVKVKDCSGIITVSTSQGAAIISSEGNLITEGTQPQLINNM